MLLRISFLLSLVALFVVGAWLKTAQEPTWVVPALMGVIFAALVAAMYLRVLPALLALPVLAIALAAIAGMSWQDVFGTVVTDGGMRLKSTILVALLGAVLAALIEQTGIAQTAVRKAAELGGDRPLVLALVLSLVVAVLFIPLGTLGAVIMVATIVVPILLATGLRPLYVGALFLLAMSLGGVFNLTNWQFFKDGLGVTNAQIMPFAIPFGALTLLATLAFLFIEAKRFGKARFKAEAPAMPAQQAPWYALLTPLVPIIPLLVFWALPKLFPPGAEVVLAKDAMLPEGGAVVLIQRPGDAPTGGVSAGAAMQVTAAPAPVEQGWRHWDVTLASTQPGVVPQQAATLEVAKGERATIAVTKDDAGAYVLKATTAPIAPYEFPIPVAMLLGIAYCAVATWRRGTSTVQQVTKAAFDGVAAVGPALLLMLGIGMVVNATMHPAVNGHIQPLLKAIMPQGTGLKAALHYVLLFAVLAPLALYRGPLNVWGLGGGILAALGGILPTQAAMAAFMSVGMIQGVSDPTNSHNVWMATYTQTDVQDILKRTLPYMWVLAVAGLALGAFMFYR